MYAERSPVPPKVPYVYILAASHSGSTLLALLLNAHPEVISVGEIVSGSRRVVDGYRCSCRQLIAECPFWRAVAEAVRREHPEFDLADFGIRWEPESPAWLRRTLRLEHRGRLAEAARDAALGLSSQWRRHFARTSACCVALARTLLAQGRARVVVDSSKLAHRLKLVRRIHDLDVKVIHLVRDGRAVALTYMDQQTYADASDPALRRGGRGAAPAPAGGEMPMAKAADEWRRCLRSAEHALAGVPAASWIRVTYEDLCARPEAVRERLFDFIGVDAARAATDFRAAEHHVVGNGMRLDTVSQIRLDERWKSVLSAQDLQVFDAVAGPLNRRLGYP